RTESFDVEERVVRLDDALERRHARPEMDALGTRLQRGVARVRLSRDHDELGRPAFGLGGHDDVEDHLLVVAAERVVLEAPVEPEREQFAQALDGERLAQRLTERLDVRSPQVERWHPCGSYAS